jgi:hypothetical protein
MKIVDVKKLKTIEKFLLNNNMIGLKYLQCKRAQKLMFKSKPMKKFNYFYFKPEKQTMVQINMNPYLKANSSNF